ncbi:MAG: four helix bundle protein [Deltaproteobacteria bacterium]|nr:four helix bundle protein [Deltaproteobacteria bacterium]
MTIERQNSALTLMLQVVARLRPIVRVIEGHDRDLTRQIRRAASSVALNLAEAEGSDRGNRRARLHTALGSAREVRAGIQVAAAWGYLTEADATDIDAALDRVAAMTWRRMRA